ncbi:MAG: hypothetical protein P8Y18_00205 [Candidatus Bathyarchaeota archaeon]
MGDLSDPILLESILKTIQIYNKYRSPEATAKFVELSKNNNFIIDFEGAFCQSCGAQDYFEDFIYDFYEIAKGFKIKISKIDLLTLNCFRVHYLFEKNIESDEENLFRTFLKEKGMTFSDYVNSNACTKDVILFHFRTWKSQLK